MRVTKNIFWIMSVIAVWFTTSQAQTVADGVRYSQLGLGVGARELGMGNATVGGVNDYSALFWNPAGLALDRNFEFSFGLSRLGYSNDVSYLGTTTTSDKSAINLNNIGIVYPVPTARGSLTFAFGFNRAANYTVTSSVNAFNPYSSFTQSTPTPSDPSLFSQDTSYNAPYWLHVADTSNGTIAPLLDGHVQQLFDFLEGGGLNHWTIGGAMDISKNFSFGVSLNFASGSYSFDGKYVEQNKGYYTYLNQIEYEATTNDDISGFNALFGLMYRKPGKYSFGLTFRTPTWYDITDKYVEVYGLSTFTDALGSYSYSYPYTEYEPNKYRITTPYVLSGGVSIQAFDWLLLAGDAEYTDWTTLEFSTDDAYLASNVSKNNLYIKNNLQATTNLRGGAEVTLWNLGLKLRGGIIYNPSPYKGDPSSYNQLYYTGGVGFDFDENATINLGYAYGTWKTAHKLYTYYDQYLHANIDEVTSETVTTNNFNITLTYRF
jgi:long-subunit fatty acid transport protein